MIGNINTGSCFKGLVNYLLDPTKQPQVIDTNLTGDRSEMIWELDRCAEQNSRCKKRVKHISIGFAPEDGKILDQTIYGIVDRVLEDLGYSSNQYLVVRHGNIDPNHDRAHDHDHFHILINMVDFEGNRVKDSYDKRRLERILRQQELEHGLTVVPDSDKRQYKAASTGQIQRVMKEIEQYEDNTRTQKIDAPYVLKIQSGIDLASYDKPSLAVFLARLQRLDIDTKFRIEGEEFTGISYRMHNFKVRGCKLHNASLSKLIDQRIDKNPELERDLTAIKKVNAGQKIELDPDKEVRWSQVSIRDYLPREIQQSLQRIFGDKKIEPINSTRQEIKFVEPEPEPKDEGWEIDF